MKSKYVLAIAAIALVIGGVGIGGIMASGQGWRITQCDLADLESLGGSWINCDGDRFFWDESDIQATGIFGHIIDYEASMEHLEFNKERLIWEQWQFNEIKLLEEDRTAAINRLAKAVENIPDNTLAIMEVANATREAASQSNVTIIW
jgi:hypothetical protein